MNPCRGFGGRGGDKLNGRARRDRSSPLHIQIGFAFARVKSGIGAIQDDVRSREILCQIEGGPEITYVEEIDVRFAYDGNGLSCSVNPGSTVDQRRTVVDRRKVRRSKGKAIGRSAEAGRGERPCFSGALGAGKSSERKEVRFHEETV